MAADLYSDPRWDAARKAVLERDNGSCVVSWLLGGQCSDGPLHVHHIIPVAEGGPKFELSNLASVCASHHPTWESLRYLIRSAREKRGRPRCPHRHVSLDARLICEAQLARRQRERALS